MGLYEALLTPLLLKDEIDYQTAKSNSPFANDSGYDYDLRGFYKKYSNFTPQASNGHLTDEFKLPIHPTFSIESRFYNGQPYAIDWRQQGKLLELPNSLDEAFKLQDNNWNYLK